MSTKLRLLIVILGLLTAIVALTTEIVKLRSELNKVEGVATAAAKATSVVDLLPTQTLQSPRPTSVQTATPSATPTAPPVTATPTVPPPSTNTPLPTPTRLPITNTPTAMPIPSPTPLPDTPPGTIVGAWEVWRQGGIEVILKDVSPMVDGTVTGMSFQLDLTNRKPQSISFTYTFGNNIIAVDNRGRPLTIGHYGRGFGYHDWCNTRTVVVPSNDIFRFDCPGSGGFLLAKADIGDTAVTEIIITISGISSINQARFRIPVSR